MIGVGAGFDYYAGKIKRAPIWMQKCSLEWLYRLMQDPRRLFKRYFITNIKFIYLISYLKTLNYAEVYLKTENASEYYKKIGWKLIESINNQDADTVDIFKCEL